MTTINHRRTKAPLLLLTVAVTVAAAFVQPKSCSTTISTDRLTATSLFGKTSWFTDSLNGIGELLSPATSLKEKNNPIATLLDDTTKSDKTGRVVRTAARAYNKEASQPSSTHYTTRKNGQPRVQISLEGVERDYNHYRKVALGSTKDRAVSLVTTDVMRYMRSMHSTSQDGDLGENLLVDGVEYRSFKVGELVRVGEQVTLEITEPMEPCANLCKLPYINDGEPRKRLEKCQKLLSQLGRHAGLRGWYAKVIQPGNVQVGDVIRVGSSK